jgi:hypothetical protein
MPYLSGLFCVCCDLCQPTSLSRRSGRFGFGRLFCVATGVLDRRIVDVFVFQLFMRISASQPLDISASQPLYRQTFVLRSVRLAGNLTKAQTRAARYREAFAKLQAWMIGLIFSGVPCVTAGVRRRK